MSFLKDIKNFFVGKPAETMQTQRFTPQQEALLNQLLQQGGQGMMGGQGGQPGQPGQMGGQMGMFGPIEQQAREGFMGTTIPSLAERFTSMGGSGGQHSSAFQGALGQAGAGLESSLAALKSQYGMQQLQMGLQPRFESSYMPSQQGMLQQGAGMLPGLMSLLMM